jgi:hypothetical protein
VVLGRELIAFLVLVGFDHGVQGGEGAGVRLGGDDGGAHEVEAPQFAEGLSDVSTRGPESELGERHAVGVGDGLERERRAEEHLEELVVRAAAVWADFHEEPLGPRSLRERKRPSTQGAFGRVSFESTRFGAGRKWRPRGGLEFAFGDFGIVVIHSRGVRAVT